MSRNGGNTSRPSRQARRVKGKGSGSSGKQRNPKKALQAHRQSEKQRLARQRIAGAATS